ncbi:MAG: hypothetical protein E3J37_08770 [Anaerolineales bacterium]|nr:MAG: hypothetical protein E3J37_08770 [Anaerolineales bacterium]
MPYNRRPALLIVICLGLLAFSAIHIAGLVASFRLPDLPLPFPDWYLLVRNGLWGLSGLIAAGGLFFSRSWAPSFTRWAGLAFVLWYWSDRLLLARSDYAKRSWLAAATITLIAVFWLFWILNRPSIQDFFRESTS